MPVQSFNQLGPPDLVTPLTITDPNPTATAVWVPDDPTYTPTGLNPAKDYVIQFSGTNRIRGVQIINGRNVVLYGMRCKLTADNTVCLFTGDGTSRIVHVQDYWVDPNSHEGDCFKTSGNSDNTIIQLKKGRCEMLLGSTDPGHVHADFVQTSGGFKELWIEDGTAITAFDGLMLQREANCETMTSADFFNVTQLTKSGNIATATCPNHNFVVGEAVGIWGAATSGWNGGWTVLSVTGSGTTKKITFQLGDTLPANLGTGAGTVAQIVRFAWGYKDGKIRINRFNMYGVASGNGLPPTVALQCIRFGARAAPQPNSSTNPVYVAGYTRVNEDHTPLTSDWWNGDMIALKWYASPPSGQTIDQFLEPDGATANFSGMRPVLHTGTPNYADWPNATKVLNASRITQGVPPTGDFVTYNASTGATAFGDPAGALDVVGGGGSVTDAPPPYVSPDTTGWTHHALGNHTAPFNYTTDTETFNCVANTNYIFDPPARQHVGSITINVATNCQILIRGLYKAIGVTSAGADPLPCASTTTQDSGALNLKIGEVGTATGAVVYIEGLHIDGNSGPNSPAWGYPVEQDGLRLSCPNTIVWLKNCRIEDLIGGLDPPHRHADVIQSDGGFKELHLEDFKGNSHYNNLYFRRETHSDSSSHLIGDAVQGKVFINGAELGGFNSNPADSPTGTNHTPGGLTTTIRAISIGTQPDPPSDNNSSINALLDYGIWIKEFYATLPSGKTFGQFVHPSDSGYVAARPAIDTTPTPDTEDWPYFRTASFPPADAATISKVGTDGATTLVNQGFGSGDAKVYGVIKLGPPPADPAPAAQVGLNFTAVFDVLAIKNSGGGPPPPPPPPPPPAGTFWDMDFGVNEPATTPFGFDIVPNTPDPVAGTIIEVVSASPLSGTGKQIGIGIRSSSFSTSPYTTEKTNGVTKPGILGVLFNWYQWQPTSWNNYDNSVLAGLDTAVDLCATETAAGRPVKLILRMVNPPTGGTDTAGTQLPNWMIAVPGTLNNSRQVRCWDMITTDGGARNCRVPIYWDMTLAYNNNFIYHYTNALQTLNTYLNGSTSVGNRRANYVLHVPIGAGLSDAGSEMSLGMGSGAASFATPVTINGVTYGNDTNGYPSVPDISVVNRNSAKTLMPAAIAADTQTAQDSWLRAWWHNLGTPVGGLATGDGAWMQMITVAMAQANYDSSVAYGAIFNDGYAAANDMLSRNAQYLKTKLWTGQTNLRVRPPGGDFGQPINTWTYRLWSSDAADLMIHALNLVSPARPLMWFQTAASIGQGGSRGCPPSDFQRAVAEAVSVYKVQQIETYAGIFTDATYGASNAAYANSQMSALQTNSDAVASGGAARGELHMKEVVAVANGPIGRNNLPTGTTDVWFRFVMDNVTAPSATVTLHLSKSTGTTGDLAVRLDSTKHLIGRWSGGAIDWTDTNVLQVGDVIDIRHVLNGATSGYEIWVNGTQRRVNLALSGAAGASVQYGQLGLANAADVEGWFYRYGAASSRMGTPLPFGSVTNGDAPVVTIVSPTAGTIYNTGGAKTVTVTASDNDGVSAMEIRADGGAWQTMTLSGSQYTASVSLSGTAGQSISHVIDVRATDGFSDTTKRLQTIATVNTLVNVPGSDTTPPTLTVTTPASNITVANGVVTQVVAGTSTDNQGVTQLLVNGTLIATTGGAFSTTVPLNVGSNVITVVAKDAAGNQTTVTRTVTQQDVVIVSPPTATISTPAQGQAFPKGTVSLTLAGTATDPVAIASVTYNIDGSSEVALALTSGAFSKVIGITPGNHTITVTATNNTGLTDQSAVTISVPLNDALISSDAALSIQRGRVIVRA